MEQAQVEEFTNLASNQDNMFCLSCGCRSAKSILHLIWNVQQQTDGTFKHTIPNVHDINDMANLKPFPIRLVCAKKTAS
jgi:hypothetical protein